ncbi:aspartyl-tRNA(Asn)/glutamyl-tRNA(Gln) amidotransferase subunit A [Nonomuraea jiangxiensis]|uniref:Aspartyl-tRNA(Asn)/glutamyl-tRNA(Gln) amidotransferase subunit A n=2 Tax=Nonomuraea jiangxiensis TaxID=633440 RepID=A0A1G7ZL73_9ACTN|nr:aspartyl-tRNA(Asn)/glutamyl-tRNA(Gln) amidotransferase subunit A [Nonomuraea jiangxiensis]
MPISPGPFTGRTITGLAQDLRAGRTTATELVMQALDAVTKLDPQLNAFVTVDHDGALAAARRADHELAAGTDRGPLHGVPVGVKDLIDVAGLPATMGSRHYAGHVPAADAACVIRLRRAGAIVVGKTTTHEFAYGPTGDRSANGPSRNPHDPERMTGGSSGGSAAAVAAGMVPLALGTDTGGSVRIPAALCGIAGFKPAYGAISADGVFPLSRTFDHVGVLAGDVRDCLPAYRALTESQLREDVSGARMAWLDPAGLNPAGLIQVDQRVTDLVRTASGARDEVRLPAEVVTALRETYLVIQSCEAAAVHAARLARAPELFGPELLERLRVAAELPGWRYVQAMDGRARLAASVGALFERHDVIALPTVPITAPPLQEPETEPDGEPGAWRGTVRATLLSMTSLWNVVGLPALTVPAGTVDGLPVGLQLVCRPGRELLLFEAAAHLPEKAPSTPGPAAP